MALNQVQLIGNLGADPEIRYTQAGDPVASFSVATTEKWTDKQSGNKKEKTEWHRVVIFSKGLCGVVEKYVKKGSKVFVQGRLETRKWTDDKEIERYTTQVVLTQIGGRLELLGDRKGGDRPPEPEPPVDLTDEIPF